MLKIPLLDRKGYIRDILNPPSKKMNKENFVFANKTSCRKMFRYRFDSSFTLQITVNTKWANSGYC